MFPDDLMLAVREFSKSDEPKLERYFYDKDVNDVATTPLSVKRCIKVTFEYSDIPEKENK